MVPDSGNSGLEALAQCSIFAPKTLGRIRPTIAKSAPKTSGKCKNHTENHAENF
jgi:hypothetical protein